MLLCFRQRFAVLGSAYNLHFHGSHPHILRNRKHRRANQTFLNSSALASSAASHGVFGKSRILMCRCLCKSDPNAPRRKAIAEDGAQQR